MRFGLTRRLRTRAGALLAALYALCVMAPPAMLAFADGAVAAHCLTATHHGASHHAGGKSTAGHSHVQGDGAVHSHADHGIPPDEGSKPGNSASCCGLFCFVAVTAESALVDDQLAPSAPVVATLDEALTGRGPERIIRPPISLLSL